MLLNVEIMNFGKSKSAESKLQIRDPVAWVAVCAIATLGLSCPYTTEDTERNPAGLQGHDLVSLLLCPLLYFHNLPCPIFILGLSFCALPFSIC